MRRFRPFTLGDIFDEAFDLYKKNFSFFFLVGAVAAIPLKVVVAFVSLHFLHSFLGVASALGGSGSPDPARLLGWLGSLAGGAALFLPFYLVVYGLVLVALATATSARYLGEPMTLFGAYRPALRRVVPYLGTALLFGLWMALGSLGFFLWFLLLLPLLLPCFLVTRLVFTAHAFALEGKGPVAALGRSNALVRGYGMPVFGCLLLTFLLYGVLSTGIELPFAYAFEAMLNLIPGGNGLLGGGQSLGGGISLRAQVIGQIGGGLAQLLILPFAVSVLTVYYYDLRVRREAFDMELLARDLGYPPLSALGVLLPPSAAPALAASLPPGPPRP